MSTPSRRTSSFAPKSQICRCLYDFERSLPICNGFCCVVGAVCVVIGMSCMSALDRTVQNFISGTSSLTKFGVASVNWCFIGSLIVFGLAFIVGIIGAGVSREQIFGRVRHPATLSTRCLRFCAGPVYTRLVQLLLLVVYIAQVLMSYLFIVVLLLSFLMDAVCKTGDSAVSTLETLSAMMKDANPDDGGASGMLDGIQEFCSTGKDVESVATRIVVASFCILGTLGPLLACVASAKERIRAELREANEMEPKGMCTSDEMSGAALEDAETEVLGRPGIDGDVEAATGEVLRRSDVERDVTLNVQEDTAAQEHLRFELASREAFVQQLKIDLAELQARLDRQASELAQELQRRRSAETALADVRCRAEQQLAIWRQSASSAAMLKWQEKVEATNEMLHLKAAALFAQDGVAPSLGSLSTVPTGTPELEVPTCEVNVATELPSIPRELGVKAVDAIGVQDDSHPLVASKRRSNGSFRPRKSKLPKSAPTIFDVPPAPIPADSSLVSPGREQQRTAPKRASCSSRRLPVTNLSDSQKPLV